ncbi:MAG: CHASE2 domain-containing protein, partial [Gammaproteobacteria bacterium]|nr:CHASE2 domain-containing protein [Gammaproteobacteria bacterium]
MSNKTRNFWAADWFTGVVFTLIFLLGVYQLARGFFYDVETAAYDQAMVMAPLTPSDAVTVVDIDDQSIANIGRWPWSRDMIGAVIERLAQGGARLIAVPILFSEPEIDPGVAEIESMAGFFAESSLADAAENDSALAQDLAILRVRMSESMERLNYDIALAGSLQTANNVILPLEIQPGQPVGSAPEPLPDFVHNSALTRIAAGAVDIYPLQSTALLAPLQSLGEKAAGTGVLTVLLDTDGTVRHESLVVDHYGTFLPSLALTVASQFLNVEPGNIQLAHGKGIQFGNVLIETDQ